MRKYKKKEITKNGLLSIGFNIPSDELCDYLLDIGVNDRSFYIKLRKSTKEREYSVELQDNDGNSVFIPTKMSSMDEIKELVVSISSKKYL